jgi:integration host factor subunit alpha
MRKKTLGKEEMAKALRRELGSLRAGKAFADDFFEIITAALAAGEEVKLHGLGVFRRLEKRPRVGRNPQTGKPAAIKRRRVAVFTAGGKLRRLVARVYDGK